MHWIDLLRGMIYEVPSRRLWSRLRGFLPTVIVVAEQSGTNMVAVVQPHDSPEPIWMLPQEGILFNETLENAAKRALEEECGIPVDRLDVRSACFVMSRKLSKSREAYKPGVLKLKGKIYYVVRVAVVANSPLESKRGDIVTAKWLHRENLWDELKANDPEKLAVYKRAFNSLNLQYTSNPNRSLPLDT
jgi:ADP-ribose pyrophosphatase YjhB (NUDIX family)